MVLESTVICMDNTEYMRNGDFLPSRMSAQVDAVSLICHTKNKQHVENAVALLTMGHEVEVVTTLTPDVTKVTTKAHAIQMRSSNLQFISAIRVACLVLKHRQNRNQRQRIVVFIGSPLREEEAQLITLAKRLRKEKVAVDVVNFGEDSTNTDRLIAFVTALNGGQSQREGAQQSGGGSHIVTIPSGGAMLNEALLSSPIVIGDEAAAAGGGAAGVGGVAAGFDFGVDPNEDPELALALRVSLEEQRARQQEEERRAQQNATASSAGASSAAAGSSAAPTATASESVSTQNRELTEDEQLQLAIQLSMAAGSSGMETDTEAQSARTAKMDTDDAEMEEAPAELLDVLNNLSTLNQNDPAVRDAVNQLAQNAPKKKDDEQKK